MLQITDSHLFASEDSDLLGINTSLSFAAVIEAIAQQGADFDFVLATGDISQDYSAESYQRFATMVRDLKRPVYFLPGNHDDGPLMYRIFSDLGVSTARSVVCGSWLFILLNSEVYGVAHGWVQREQLEYIERCVGEFPGLNTAVCVHHLPLLVDSRWLDTQTLHNQDEFLAFVSRFPAVRLVVSGHVHQEYDCLRHGVRYIASPSTSVQFLPHSHDFALDSRGPGWRYFALDAGGGIKTTVCRLGGGRFRPRDDIGGYQ